MQPTNPARQYYDYSQNGISGFLSRTIDDVDWENTLDAHMNTLSNVPVQTTQMNYDNAQVTGSLGNTLQLNSSTGDGGVTINSDGITANDGTNDFLIIGNDGSGN